MIETKISIPEQLCLRSFELNVVLGNLLDNAIDASMQTEDKKLKITVKMDKGILFLYIMNLAL
ncbi:MAG: GHKL domain-containing protein [Lachnospiraceae bacterium]